MSEFATKFFRASGLALLAVATASSLSGCGGQVHSQELTQQTEVELGVPVETAAVESGEVRAYYRGTAVIEADRRADVVAEATGLVTELLVEEGDAVREGQVLARLDTERAQLMVQQAKARLDQAKRAYDRQLLLVERKMASDEEAEQLRAEYEQQLASLALVELDLKKSAVRAPFAGLITERFIKIGQHINTNQKTFGLSDFGSLKAMMSVPERNSSSLQAGQAVAMNFLAFDDLNVQGSIERVSPVVDADSGTVRVTVAVPNNHSHLRPGLLAEIDVLYEQHDATALVPNDALVLERDVTAVYVVDDGQARRIEVTTGLTEGNRTEVMSGLLAGQTVITSGQNRLEDGAKVDIVSTGP